jgi:hypothetical protein
MEPKISHVAGAGLLFLVLAVLVLLLVMGSLPA